MFSLLTAFSCKALQVTREKPTTHSHKVSGRLGNSYPRTEGPFSVLWTHSLCPWEARTEEGEKEGKPSLAGCRFFCTRSCGTKGSCCWAMDYCGEKKSGERSCGARGRARRKATNGSEFTKNTDEKSFVV